jgi:hypothetical protein
MKRKPVIRKKKYPKCARPGACWGKTIYPSENDARRGITMIWSKDPNADLNDLHSYYCVECEGWHNGHRSYYLKLLQKQPQPHLQPHSQPHQEAV